MAKVRFDAKKKKFVADVRDVIGNSGGGQKQFSTRSDAKQHILTVQAAQKQHGEYVDPHTTPLLAAAAAKWAEGQHHAAHLGEQKKAHARQKELAMHQIGDVLWGLKPLKQFRVGEVRAPMMHDIVKSFAETLGSQATLARKWGYCVQFFDYCVAVGWTQSNPAKLPRGTGLGLPPVTGSSNKPPLIRISREIINAITDAASPDVQLAIKVAWGTGIRQGEQRALQWGPDGLDTTAGTLHVTRALDIDHKLSTPKNKNAVRSIPLAPDLLSELRAWRVAQPSEQRRNNLVFPSATGGIIDHKVLRERGLYRACERAGVGLIRWHDLRHYFASIILFDPSFNEATVTQLLGHHSISFTKNVYGHWMDDTKRDAGLAEALGRALR